MHILIHDFAGHPFQVQLSRHLAAQGHRVTHAWFAGDSGPKGSMQRQADDAAGLQFLPLGAGLRYNKANFLRRRQGDVAYGRILAGTIQELSPDIVLCGNTPTEAMSPIAPACRNVGAAFIPWVQDLNGLASRKILSRIIPGIGHLVGSYYMWLEAKHLRAADHVIAISEGFLTETDRMKIPRSQISVIQNWGALDEIPLLDRATQWRRDQGLTRTRLALYSGTLALKHNPRLLRALAEAVDEFRDTSIVVVSAGVGADLLAREQAASPVSSLELRGLQSFGQFPEVLASADVLLAVLEREAGLFSVPSKILSYMCAGRPIVLAAPSDNLAAKIVAEVGAGLVVDPEDEAGFVAAALHFLKDQSAANEAATRARAFAESEFDIDRISERFQLAFSAAKSQSAVRKTSRRFNMSTAFGK